VIRLERITDALPSGFAAMRAEARAEGHSMLDTLAAEWESGAKRFDREGEGLVATILDGDLAGIGGLTVEAAIPGAFRMRRFYVRQPFRRGGIGRALAATLLEEATGRTVTANAAAGSEPFWESLGFVPDRRNGWTHIRPGAVNARADDA
jgi:GNAT superfamily N-acetyltransferase